METVVEFVQNGGKIEENRAAQDSSSLSPSKQIADPVVYKLVRVEGDGRFVPATDDEVMEVEDFLEDDKEKVAEAGDSVGCVSTEGLLLQNPHLEISNGLSNLESDAGYNARLEYIEEVLQKVKQEERLRLTRGSPSCSSAYTNETGDGQCLDEHDKLPDKDDKLQTKISSREIVCPASLSLSESCLDHPKSNMDCAKHLDRSVESESLHAICTTSGPDFSLLKGEVCLDNLSIRELHEYFRATFGRGTTVKDKSWLKRRIAMGLTNSCDIPSSPLVIKEGRLVIKGHEESSQNVESNSDDAPVDCGDPLTANWENKDRHYAANMDFDSGCENQHEQKATVKRIRKPTKRYIEELSEEESREYSQKAIDINKNLVTHGTFLNSIIKPIKKVSSDGGRTVITRMDSLGGSGLEVPCVSRVRRSRPRKDVVALMFALPDKDQKTSMMETDELEKNVVHKQIETNELEKNVEQKQMAFNDTSDDNTGVVPTSKGGVRRKHHRAWTLVEVIKLVDGVSKCGAGRWSEIKKLAFASYSYRTSVDLKDKWRNLLKASFAQTPVDEGITSRKHTSVPIPAQILLRVRELAEMHAQVPSNHGSAKLGVVSERSIHVMSSVC